MTGDVIRTQALADRSPIVQCVRDVQARLRKLRLFQPVVRILQAQLAHGVAKKRVNLSFDREVLAHLIEQSLTHASLLRALSRKYESNHVDSPAVIFCETWRDAALL